MKQTITRWIAVWFGVGYFPFAQGTASSLVALPLGYYIKEFFGWEGLLVATTFVFFLGWYVVTIYCQTTDDKDPREAVIDEVPGQWIPLLILPQDWRYYAIGFVLFRFFDIIKPWPIDWCERRFETPFGVMFDDIVAGVFALVVSWGILFFL
jgi:phosphatidylglycerophosphatase A